jgi:uncharacterized repeat protein (TIGR02543 family)
MILLLMMSMTMLTQMKSNHVEAMNVFENLAFFEQLSPDPLLENDKVIQVALGAYQSIAVTENGRVFAWGYNHQGQLGDGSITTRRVPTNISDGFNLSEGDKVIQVSAANAHSSALTENGKVFFWGDNAFGQLGDASATDQLLPVDITDVFNLSEGDKVIQISLGDYFSSALTSTGRVFTWGRNNQGQLGIGSDIDQLLPIDITDNLNLTEDDKVIQISLGSVHSSVLTQNGKVLTWGLNYYGQLGDNTTMFKLVPTDISDRFPAGDKVIQLSMGASHSSARTESGKIYTWGRNLSGELGDDSTTSKSVPTDITGGFPAEDKVIQLSLQGVHSSALTESGKVFVWGDNQYGQVGDDSTTNKLVPIDITSGFQAGDKVIQLSLGGYHSSALTESGEVYTWGFNVMSQLGDNTIVSKRVPMLLDTIGAPLSFTMSFNSNGGSAVNHIEEYEGTEISAPTTPTKSGYTFGGWYSDSALTTTFIFATMPSENIILYAKWNIEDYDISYTLNDGTNHQDNPVIYHIETPTITLASPTKNGYAFAGWYDNADFNGSAITSIPMGSAGDKILYAKWTINQYTITFNTSGGSEVAAITQDYGTPISAPVNPTRVGHTFNGWSQAIPVNMPADSIAIRAFWILYSQDTGDISTETEDLHNKYDASLTEGKDAEIIIKIRVQPEDSLLPTEGTVFSDTVKNDLQLRRSGSLFLNIEIILKEVGQEDVLVQELLDPLAITIVIPQKHQGYQDYHIIRMHNGVAEALDTQYDAQNQTLTFETDRFSTYMIAYDMASGSGWWWLLLLLVIPVAFLIYRYTKKASNQAINNEKQDALEPLEEVVRFEEVVIKNIEERPQYKAFEKVDNGDYLEITPDLEASNNVVEVSTGVLPKLMNDQNHFIPLEENEVPQFKLSDVSLVVYHKLTPGSYTESGYFMEVDLNNRSVEYYVYTKRRLPPTSAKGHRWVRIESRKIKTD